MPKFELITTIKAPIEICFDLSRSIDLHKISTKHTNEEAIAGVTSGLIGKDESVTWRAKHLGIYQKLTSKITAFEYPNYFQDTMTEGIFKSIIHDHLFSEENGITTMKDIFKYESPLGILGRLADFIFLEKYLLNLLSRRNLTIKEFAESGKWKHLLKH